MERVQYVPWGGQYARLVWYFEVPWILPDLQYRDCYLAKSGPSGEFF